MEIFKHPSKQRELLPSFNNYQNFTTFLILFIKSVCFLQNSKHLGTFIICQTQIHKQNFIKVHTHIHPHSYIEIYKAIRTQFLRLSKVCLDPFFFPLGCIAQVSYNKYVLVQQWRYRLRRKDELCNHILKFFL